MARMLTLHNVSKIYYRKKREIAALKQVFLTLEKGKTLALVGPSGSGKSTLAKLIMGIEPLSDGQIFYRGIDLAKATKSEKKIIQKEIQIIFQDPYSSLNPRMSVSEILEEPLLIHKMKKNRQKRVDELLDLVQLPKTAKYHYPHQFSGGQRQRIAIARALSLRPSLLICDEPVSALDLSIQSQIINLLQDLKKEANISYLFISHDLTLVQHIADEVIILSDGKIVEKGLSTHIFSSPKSSMAKELIAASALFPTLV